MSSAMEVKRAILQCCTSILDGSNSLYRDVLIATVSCHSLRPPNHLYVILSYDNRTGVDQCLWLSVVLVILVRDSWMNHWSTFSGRIVVVLKNQLDIGLSTVALVCLFASIVQEEPHFYHQKVVPHLPDEPPLSS